MRRDSLQHCADTVVGNGNLRGMSGGEKRRLSLGVELVRMHVCVLVNAVDIAIPIVCSAA